MKFIIRSEVHKHVNKLDLLSEDQRGFMKGKSCTNLLVTIGEVSAMLDKGGGVDIISGLIQGLQLCSTRGYYPNCHLIEFKVRYGSGLKIFLIGRKQNVTLGMRNKNGQISSMACHKIQSLVPFFSSNDLSDNASLPVNSFADGTKLYPHNKNEHDELAIQDDLKWSLRFNATKCTCMHMGGTHLGMD